MEGNVIGKSILFTIIIYIVLNLICTIVMLFLGYLPDPAALGNATSSMNIGTFFGAIGTDPVGFVAMLFAPAGSSFIDNFYACLANLTSDSYELYVDAYGIGITSLLRTNRLEPITYGLGLAFVLLPPLVTSIIVKKKIAQDEPKAGTIGFIVGFLICAIIPMILSIANMLFPMEPNHADYVLTTIFVSQNYFPPGDHLVMLVLSILLDMPLPALNIEWETINYLIVIFNGLFTALIFAGISSLFGNSD